MHRIVLIASLFLLFALPLTAQEEEVSDDNTFFIGIQLPVLQFVHYDDDSDFLTFGVGPLSTNNILLANPAPASLQFGFKPMDPLWILMRFGFNLNFANDDNVQNQLTIGIGARIDIPMDDIVGFVGLMLEYNFFDFPSSGNDAQCHGIGIVPFGGIEYMVTDYFGVGGQLQLGYLWLRQERDTQSAIGTVRASIENHGMILALLLSASVYF